MAIDTKAKRKRSLAVATRIPVYPDPDASHDATDRAHMTWNWYAGGAIALYRTTVGHFFMEVTSGQVFKLDGYNPQDGTIIGNQTFVKFTWKSK